MVHRPAKVYNGSTWDDIGDSRLVSGLASKPSYAYSDTEPTTGLVGGFLWFDTNDSPPTPYYYDDDAEEFVPFALVTNTDGDPGRRIFVGSIDPDVGYTLLTGDVWIEVK